jgi:hypothetical protein
MDIVYIDKYRYEVQEQKEVTVPAHFEHWVYRVKKAVCRVYHSHLSLGIR